MVCLTWWCLVKSWTWWYLRFFQLNWFCKICCSSLFWQLIDVNTGNWLSRLSFTVIFKFILWSSIVFNLLALWITDFFPQGQSLIIIKCFYRNCDMKRAPKTVRILNLDMYLLSFLEKCTFKNHHISLQIQNGLSNCFDSSDLSLHNTYHGK